MMTGLFSMEVIRRFYDEQMLARVKDYSKMNRQYMMLVVRKTFLIKCRRELVIPSHLSANLRSIEQSIDLENPYNRKIFRVMDCFKRKVLSLEIGICYWKLKKLRHKMCKVRLKIIRGLSPEIGRDFMALQKHVFESGMRKNCERTNMKLMKLIEESRVCVSAPNMEKSFKNISNMEMPMGVKQLFSFGPKFSVNVRPDEKQVFNIIADVEHIIRMDVSPLEKDEFRSRSVNILHNHLNRKPARDKEEEWINNKLWESKKFLKDNPEIIVINADKGNVSVAMNKVMYMDKMEDMLSDQTTYIVMPRDKTKQLQDVNNDLIEHLYNQNQMELRDVNRCIVRYGIAPRIYGLIKVHKENYPLRPVVSFVNSPTYHTARYLSDILSGITDKTKYFVRDSFDFQKFITTQVIPAGHCLISLDVSSLFTNIPQKLVMKIIQDRWDQIKDITKIVKTSFIKLLKNCMDASMFMFNGCYYKQLFGMPMGSPLSPVLGDLVMETLLDDVVPRLPFTIQFIKKYVDDIITVVPEDKIQEVVRIFNQFHGRLQFTYEKEVEGKIPFLDVLIIKNSGALETKWYSKPLASGRLLNYKSNHVNSMKINVAYGFAKRVFDLTSICHRKEMETVVYDLLLSNNYPRFLIKRLVLRYLENVSEPDPDMAVAQHPPSSHLTQQSSVQLITHYRSMSYMKGLSEQLLKLIKIYIPNIGIGFSSKKNLKNLVYSKMKDPVPISQMSGVVYEIPCGDCSDVYVGHTGTSVKQRMSKHKSDIRLGKTEVCATAQHSVEMSHQLDFENVSILEHSEIVSKRLVLEMLYIQKYGTMNRKTDCDGLSRCYAAVRSKLEEL